MFFSKTKKGENLQRGITMFEMVVVIAIVTIMTTILVASYPRFGDRFSLSSIAREVALTFRSAQVFGVAVREFPASEQEYPPFGIYADTTDLSNNQTFTLFGDRCNGEGDCGVFGNFNGIYDEIDGCGGGETECMETLTISNKARIDDVCVGDVITGTERCSADETDPVTRIDITFIRPNPDAKIRINAEADTWDYAEIFLSSRKYPDVQKVVRVWITGQIAVIDEI